ncbi:MAG: GtrA family protein [Sedimentibacter saalensis]|uniref:GtrA family protein n=1 Tax=Sedimentibacter saalensis TaxID=130788 RepID=UPI002B209596|nr:GtrA family protein [Sedimentibacter saalensis]MEA5093478.1 GtrA family protein [Sedimentibacter saalensis]
MNVYDFDKTIYDGDSTIDFYFSCVKKYPKILLYLPVQGYYMILYLLNKKSKTKFKEKFYIFLKDIQDIDYEVNSFWQKNIKKIKGWYYFKQSSNDIIISASPEFLLRPICNILNVNNLIASRVNKKTGEYSGVNCHGEEKLARLLELFPNIKIEEFFSDSFSDQPLATIAKESYIVRKNKIYKWNEFIKRKIFYIYKNDMFRYVVNNGIFRYIFFGALTVFVNLLSYLISKSILGFSVNHANILSIIIAILFAYIVNSKFVFKSDCNSIKQKLREFLKFISARFTTMIIEVVGLIVFTEIFMIDDFLSKILIQLIVLVLNYILSKLLVFKNNY